MAFRSGGCPHGIDRSALMVLFASIADSDGVLVSGPKGVVYGTRRDDFGDEGGER